MGVHLQVAVVMRAADILFGDVRGAAQQRSVAEDLHRAQPQPIVAQAGADAGVEAPGVRICVVPRNPMQRVQHHHRLHAHAQQPLVAGTLVGAKLPRRVADPSARDAGVGDTGDALGQVVGRRQIQRALDGGQRVGQHDVLHQPHGVLFQQSGGPALSVSGDDAAVDRRCEVRPAFLDQVEGDAVDIAGMAGGMLDPDRAAAGGSIEPVTVRLGAVMQQRAVPRGHHPLVLRQRRSGFGYHRIGLVEARDGPQVRLHQAEPEPHAVGVHIVEAGDNHGAFGVDNPSGAGHALLVDVECQHLPVVDQQAFSHRLCRILGQDAGVADQEIDEHESSSCFRCGVPGAIVANWAVPGRHPHSTLEYCRAQWRNDAIISGRFRQLHKMDP